MPKSGTVCKKPRLMQDGAPNETFFYTVRRFRGAEVVAPYNRSDRFPLQRGHTISFKERILVGSL